MQHSKIKNRTELSSPSLSLSLLPPPPPPLLLFPAILEPSVIAVLIMDSLTHTNYFV
jgi:hypothetical protein